MIMKQASFKGQQLLPSACPWGNSTQARECQTWGGDAPQKWCGSVKGVLGRKQEKYYYIKLSTEKQSNFS